MQPHGPLVPPLVAIILALITKEVYSSLFIGIVVGGLFYANFSPKLTYLTIFTDITDGGMLAKLSDSGNVGILIFLVILGIMVALMNKAGGSAAYGRWAVKAIKQEGAHCCPPSCWAFWYSWMTISTA